MRVYLYGFGFDGAQSVTWHINSWPGTGNGTEVLNGTLAMDASGDGYTTDYSLPNGHYKLFWNFNGENGAAKQKVFWVKCPAPTPSSTTPGGTPTSQAPDCTCASTPPTIPPPTTQTPPSHVPAAPAPTAVTGSLAVTG